MTLSAEEKIVTVQAMYIDTLGGYELIQVVPCEAEEAYFCCKQLGLRVFQKMIVVGQPKVYAVSNAWENRNIQEWVNCTTLQWYREAQPDEI